MSEASLKEPFAEARAVDDLEQKRPKKQNHWPPALVSHAYPTWGHLLIFAGTLALPVILFAVALAWFYISAEQGRAMESAKSSARELLFAVDRELAGPRLMLEALATSPFLQDGDLGAFYARASAIYKATGFNIVLREPGRSLQLLNTSVPWGAPLVGGNPDIPRFEQEVLQTKRPVVSNLIVGPLNGRWVIVLMVPVLKEDRVIYFLSVGIPADHMASVLQQRALDEGWIAALIDGQGKIIARSAAQDRFVGQAAPPEWMSQASNAEGVWTGLNLEGVEVAAAYARSSQTNWTVAVHVPLRVLNTPIWNALSGLVATGAVALIMAVTLAYLTGMRLSRAIHGLQKAGTALANGESIETFSTSVREVNEVGEALKIAASEAQRREAHLRSILATVPSAMVVSDSQGKIRSFSATAEKLFGYPAEAVLGKDVSLLMPEPDRSAHDGYIERYLTTGQARIIGKGRIAGAQRKDGTVVPVELHVGEADTDGEKIFTAFLYDQTEKQRIEQELRQAQKMEAVGRLTGGVAHDFNNLLTVIKGNLERLEPQIPEKYQNSISDAQEAVDLAAQLTSGLLAFGRRMPLNPTRCDVGQLVTATGDLLKRTLGETIEVCTEISGSCYAKVDAPQLQNAILNLAINARDAMPDGGKLSISVSASELDDDYVAAYPDVRAGRYALISISDTGSGMTKEVKERAFEPFFTTKPQGSGTGLGLSSVYGFAKQSEGHVALYSEVGLGTTVRIYLPYEGEKDRTQAQAVNAALPRSGGEQILVVEDDDRVRRITVARLSQLGYRVREATNGPAALTVLEEYPSIDLLFTDMVMPGGISGLELAAKARLKSPRLRVLFSSGYAEPDSLNLVGAESADWLRKPYTTADLAQKLHEVFEEKKAD